MTKKYSLLCIRPGNIGYWVFLALAGHMFINAMLNAKAHNLLPIIFYTLTTFVLGVAALICGTWYQVSSTEKKK